MSASGRKQTFKQSILFTQHHPGLIIVPALSALPPSMAVVYFY